MKQAELTCLPKKYRGVSLTTIAASKMALFVTSICHQIINFTKDSLKGVADVLGPSLEQCNVL